MRFFIISILSFSLISCATPVSKVPTGSDEEIAAEFEKQQGMVLEQRLDRQIRLRQVGYRILEANSDLCGENVTYFDGFIVWNKNSLANKERKIGERTFGLGQRYQVMLVDKGYGADKAGLRQGDVVLSAHGIELPEKHPSKALKKIQKEIRDLPEYTMTIDRDGEVMDKVIRRDIVCDYGIIYDYKEPLVNAFADGDNITFTLGMMDFLEHNDQGLQIIMGHEIAHNLMQHIEKGGQNMGVGMFGGLILDVAAAAAGVNTNGEFARLGGGLGRQFMSPEFEAEADYVGLYLMARAGYSTKGAEELWRKMSINVGGPREYATSHPTQPERFLILNKTHKEIQNKKARGKNLEPDFVAMDTGESHYENKAKTGWWE